MGRSRDRRHATRRRPRPGHRHREQRLSAARRYLPSDAADLGRSLVPLGLLALAAAVHELRVVVLLLLVGGTAVAMQRRAPVRWAWAGAVPVAGSLVWGLIPLDYLGRIQGYCGDPGSPLLILRVLEFVVVGGVLVALALALRASRTSLALRLPARRYRAWALAAFVVLGPVALVLGPYLSRPWFGATPYDVLGAGPAAFGIALVFALANGVLEEVTYRGALLGWSAKVMGIGPAVVGQAVVFGLAHGGPDVGGSPLPLMLALGVGGLVAGLIAVRTRSLLIPIAAHVALDLPIYYAIDCPV